LGNADRFFGQSTRRRGRTGCNVFAAEAGYHPPRCNFPPASTTCVLRGSCAIVPSAACDEALACRRTIRWLLKRRESPDQPLRLDSEDQTHDR
jgi:hypothetical protein